MSAQTRKVVAPEISADWAGKLQAAVPEVTLLRVEGDALNGELAGADGFIGKITPEQLAMAPRLRWVQVISAGVDDVIFPELAESNVTLTNMRNVYGPEIGDHAFAFLLGLTRKLRMAIDQQQREVWRADRTGMIELAGKTAVIVGVGGIGRHIAQRAFGFGMNVIGVDVQTFPPDLLVGRYVHPDQLDEVLPLADVVFNAVPLTRATHGLIGERQFALMKRGSYFIAVSRGKTYSLDALVKALEERRLAGAGVDVTEPEPLPPGHPLWKFDNVIITPHMSNGSDELEGRMLGLLAENLARFASGRPLLHVVDMRAGF